MLIDVALNYELVIVLMVERKALKNDLMLLNVSCAVKTSSLCSVSVVTFARFNATSDSIQDVVSSPDANPLNDIVTALSCYLLFHRVATKTQIGRGFKLSDSMIQY